MITYKNYQTNKDSTNTNKKDLVGTVFQGFVELCKTIDYINMHSNLESPTKTKIMKIFSQVSPNIIDYISRHKILQVCIRNKFMDPTAFLNNRISSAKLPETKRKRIAEKTYVLGMYRNSKLDLALIIMLVTAIEQFSIEQALEKNRKSTTQDENSFGI
jgi:hypothetical protein